MICLAVGIAKLCNKVNTCIYLHIALVFHTVRFQLNTSSEGIFHNLNLLLGNIVHTKYLVSLNYFSFNSFHLV